MSAAAEVATEVIETVADAAEETVVALDYVSNLNGTTRKQQIIVLVAVGVAAAAAGAAVSHFITKKIVKTRLQEIMDEELERTKRFYENREHIAIDKSEPVTDPEDMLFYLAAAKLVKEKGDDPANLETFLARGENEFLAEGPSPTLQKLAEAGQEAVAVKKNAFDQEDITKLWTAQNDAAIAEDKPHVITKQEFFEAENDWPQISYTYFDGDGVLADEKEDMVPDVEASVGQMNLTRFGWLSEDNNTVYVRNPEAEIEFEVVQSMGTYAAEVHGFNQPEDTFEARRGKIRYGED